MKHMKNILLLRVGIDLGCGGALGPIFPSRGQGGKMEPILIYKRTHSGDPDHRQGIFGNNNCMGQVRNWKFGAVIGVGGIGRKAMKANIAKKLNWIGIGPHRNNDSPPKIVFDHFWYRGKKGESLDTLAPALAKRIYTKNVRLIKDGSLTAQELKEVCLLLNYARSAPPSKGPLPRKSRKKSKRCGGCSS